MLQEILLYLLNAHTYLSILEDIFYAISFSPDLWQRCCSHGSSYKKELAGQLQGVQLASPGNISTFQERPHSVQVRPSQLHKMA